MPLFLPQTLDKIDSNIKVTAFSPSLFGPQLAILEPKEIKIFDSAPKDIKLIHTFPIPDGQYTFIDWLSKDSLCISTTSGSIAIFTLPDGLSTQLDINKPVSALFAAYGYIGLCHPDSEISFYNTEGTPLRTISLNVKDVLITKTTFIYPSTLACLIGETPHIVSIQKSTIEENKKFLYQKVTDINSIHFAFNCKTSQSAIVTRMGLLVIGETIEELTLDDPTKIVFLFWAPSGDCLVVLSRDGTIDAFLMSTYERFTTHLGIPCAYGGFCRERQMMYVFSEDSVYKVDFLRHNGTIGFTTTHVFDMTNSQVFPNDCYPIHFLAVSKTKDVLVASFNKFQLIGHPPIEFKNPIRNVALFLEYIVIFDAKTVNFYSMDGEFVQQYFLEHPPSIVSTSESWLCYASKNAATVIKVFDQNPGSMYTCVPFEKRFLSCQKIPFETPMRNVFVLDTPQVILHSAKNECRSTAPDALIASDIHFAFTIACPSALLMTSTNGTTLYFRNLLFKFGEIAHFASEDSLYSMVPEFELGRPKFKRQLIGGFLLYSTFGFPMIFSQIIDIYKKNQFFVDILKDTVKIAIANQKGFAIKKHFEGIEAEAASKAIEKAFWEVDSSQKVGMIEGNFDWERWFIHFEKVTQIEILLQIRPQSFGQLLPKIPIEGDLDEEFMKECAKKELFCRGFNFGVFRGKDFANFVEEEKEPRDIIQKVMKDIENWKIGEWEATVKFMGNAFLAQQKLYHSIGCFLAINEKEKIQNIAMLFDIDEELVNEFTK